MSESPIIRPEVTESSPDTLGREQPERSQVPPTERPPDTRAGGSIPVQPIPVPSPAPAPLAPAKLPLSQHVEEVMSSGLADTYAQMDPATQQKFRTVGEETAGKISSLLQASKVQAKKIVELLVAWLRIIPGVNQFFLEQEAKIKADKILALKQRE